MMMEFDDLVAPRKLILASPKGRGRLIVLARRNMTIGRDTASDVVLDSELVSRRHATLVTDGPFVTLQDLGSRNGTYVNGGRVQTAVLADRDIIEIGDCILRFLALDQEAVSPEMMSAMMTHGGQLYRRGADLRA